MNTSEIISTFITYIHALCPLLSIILPLLFNNKYLYYLLLIYNSIIIIGWVLFNKCILTPLEDYLHNRETEKYEDGSDKSQIVNIYKNILHISDKNSLLLLTFIPYVSIIICIVRLHYYKE
jgi:hypothetical protein